MKLQEKLALKIALVSYALTVLMFFGFFGWLGVGIGCGAAIAISAFAYILIRFTS